MIAWLKAWWRWHVRGQMTAKEVIMPLAISADLDVAVDTQTGDRAWFKAGCQLPEGWRWATEEEWRTGLLKPLKRNTTNTGYIEVK